MQTCDQTCHWCASYYFKWLKARLRQMSAPSGRSGVGSFELNAGNDIKPTLDPDSNQLRASKGIQS